MFMYFNMYIVCLAYIYIYIKSYVLNCRNHRSSLFSASSISYVSNYRDPTAFDEIFFDFRIMSAILTNTSIIIIQLINIIYADPGGHTVWEVGLRLLACWDVGSNLTGDMNVCLVWVLFVVTQRSLRRADHSSRGFLRTVVRRRVWSRNLVNKEVTAHWGLLH